MSAPAGLPVLFLLLGGSLLAGWLAHLLFQRHRVSDILVLLALGVLVGPVLGLVDATALRPALLALAPFGLVIVLFEGGLELSWRAVREHAGRAFLFALLAWGATAAAMYGAGRLLLGLDAPLSLLFAVIVAATGILAVIPLLQQLRLPAEPRVLLTVETSLGDLLSAVAVVAVASALVAGASPLAGLGLFGAKVVVGASVGLLAGFVGARALHHVEAERHAYAVTLAALLLAYAAAETLGGSGFLSALAFGLVLGNVPALVKLGGLRDIAPLPATMRLQQTTLIFLLRSVYFVLLGVTLPRDALGASALLAMLVLAALLVGSRALAVALVARGRAPEERLLLVALMPRGLAAAVLATVPAAMGVPGADALVTYAFLAIVAADLATSAGLMLHARRTRRAQAREDAAAAPAP